MHLGEGAGEYGQGLATRQSGRWSQDGIEASVSCSCGEKLGDPVVVGEQIALVDVEMFANRWVGEVEYVEVDGDAPGAAAELERIDAVIDGVPEELGPRPALDWRRTRLRVHLEGGTGPVLGQGRRRT
ncbi:MAG: hypothetical protein R2701_00245 [Acidimicrobiales bacterium]